VSNVKAANVKAANVEAANRGRCTTKGGEPVHARTCVSAVAGVAFAAIVGGCGSPYPQVQVDVPDIVLERIWLTAPARESGLYVLQSAAPQTVEDLAERRLLVCDDIDSEPCMGLITSSLGARCTSVRASGSSGEPRCREGFRRSGHGR
jgi:hypothetical protein